MDTATTRANIELCRRAMAVMSTGEPADFAAVFHPEATNREARTEPPPCRGRGWQAFHATALWLRSAHSGLRWEIHDAVGDGDLVALHVTMSGRQTGPFVTYGPDGLPARAMPATGRTFAVRQTHWFRTSGGLILEHWANRDDLGLARQLGWTPPTPLFRVRAALAGRAARRRARDTARGRSKGEGGDRAESTKASVG